MKKLLIACLLFATAWTKIYGQAPDSLLKSMPAGASPADKIEFLTALISGDSTKGIYYDKRAQAYDAMDKPESALQDLQRAESLGYADSDLYSYMGYVASRIPDNGKAILYFTKAIQQNPDNAMLYAYRGYAYMVSGQSALAENDYSIYLNEHKDDAISWYAMGRAQEDLNEHEKAVFSFKNALELDSTNIDTHFRLGMVYGNLAKYKEAIHEFDIAIRRKPDAPYLYMNRGMAKAKSGLPFCDDFKKCADLGYTLGADMYAKYCGGSGK